MIFLAALISFFIDAFDVTVVTCDAQWLERAQLEQILAAEVNELIPENRRGWILTVDRCDEASVRLRASHPGGQRERVVQIGDIPAEARLRTIALALGELARETDAEPESKGESVARPNPEESGAGPNNADVKRLPGESMKRAVTAPATPPASPLSQPVSVPAAGKGIQVSVGAYLRSFPLARTIAPEARVGVRTPKWHLDLGGYGMGWRVDVGAAYLVAMTLTVGPVLWRREGSVDMGLDALLELGAITAIGKADEGDVENKPKFNIAAGGHLSYWLAPGAAKRFQPTLVLELGWLRGLNAFAVNAFQGGFEGLSAAAGMAGVW